MSQDISMSPTQPHSEPLLEEMAMQDSVKFDWYEPCLPGYRPFVSEDSETYSNPDVAASVWSLALRGISHPKDDPFAWSVLSRLTNIQQLELAYVEQTWPYITPEDVNFLRNTFPKVETLRLEDNGFCGVDNFLTFLSAFPQVKVLNLIEFTFDEPLKDEDMRQQHVLDSTPCCGHGWPTDEHFQELIEKWIVPLSRRHESTLALRWHNTFHNDIITFPAFIEAIAPILGSLEVTVLDRLMELDETSIGLCTKLESITFTCIGTHTDPPRPCALGAEWAFEIIYQLRSPMLKTIAFNVVARTVSSSISISHNMWRVPEALLEPRFANVIFILTLPSLDDVHDLRERDRLIGLFIEPLAELQARGQLQIRPAEQMPEPLV